MDAEVVRSVFPEVERIGDADLQANVVAAWVTAMTDHGVSDLSSVPWFPPVQRDLGVEDEVLVEHIRDVTLLSIELGEFLRERRDVAVAMDTVIAGALIHDVSKLAEFDGMAATSVYDLLGHPYYGIHIVLQAGLPIELAHIVLSHTRRTTVEPATIEAAIVQMADEIAATAIRTRATDDLSTR